MVLIELFLSHYGTLTYSEDSQCDLFQFDILLHVLGFTFLEPHLVRFTLFRYRRFRNPTQYSLALKGVFSLKLNQHFKVIRKCNKLDANKSQRQYFEKT